MNAQNLWKLAEFAYELALMTSHDSKIHLPWKRLVKKEKEKWFDTVLEVTADKHQPDSITSTEFIIILKAAKVFFRD